MEPKIITKEGFKVIGLQFRGNNVNNACPKLWESFSKRVQEVKPLTIEPITAFGICTDFDMKNNIFTYTAGLEVADFTIIPPEMKSLVIPKQNYAVFKTTLPRLMQTIDEIYKKWLPKAEYIRSQGPEFELYDAEFDPEKADSNLYLYIPILKK